MTNKYQNKIQDERITRLEDQFANVCSKYNEEIGEVKVNIARLATNQRTLLWFMFAVLGGVISLWLK